MGTKKVFIDTDICDDIDDLWALLLALNIEEIDIIGISVSFGMTLDKGLFVAKLLNDLSINDIPIFIGEATNKDSNNHYDYFKGFKFEDYKGPIYLGFDRISGLFDRYDDFYILGLGPTVNIIKMLDEYPLLNKKAKVVLMGGAFYKGYINQDYVAEEYNVLMDIENFRNICSKINDLVICPLDVCRDIIIDGKNYNLIINSEVKANKILIDNYILWDKVYRGGAIKYDTKTSSTILYDLIPILYLVVPQYFTKRIEKFNILDNGVTKVTESGKYCSNVLIEINNIEEVYSLIMKYLLGGKLSC